MLTRGKLSRKTKGIREVKQTERVGEDGGNRNCIKGRSGTKQSAKTGKSKLELEKKWEGRLPETMTKSGSRFSSAWAKKNVYRGPQVREKLIALMWGRRKMCWVRRRQWIIFVDRKRRCCQGWVRVVPD